MTNQLIKLDEYGLFIFPVRICTDKQLDALVCKNLTYLWFREYNWIEWFGINFIWRKRGPKGGEGWK